MNNYSGCVQRRKPFVCIKRWQLPASSCWETNVHFYSCAFRATSHIMVSDSWVRSPYIGDTAALQTCTNAHMCAHAHTHTHRRVQTCTLESNRNRKSGASERPRSRNRRAHFSTPTQTLNLHKGAKKQKRNYFHMDPMCFALLKEKKIAFPFNRTIPFIFFLFIFKRGFSFNDDCEKKKKVCISLHMSLRGVFYDRSCNCHYEEQVREPTHWTNNSQTKSTTVSLTRHIFAIFADVALTARQNGGGKYIFLAFWRKETVCNRKNGNKRMYVTV